MNTNNTIQYREGNEIARSFSDFVEEHIRAGAKEIRYTVSRQGVIEAIQRWEKKMGFAPSQDTRARTSSSSAAVSRNDDILIIIELDNSPSTRIDLLQ